jgi:hypothetical protein
MGAIDSIRRGDDSKLPSRAQICGAPFHRMCGRTAFEVISDITFALTGTDTWAPGFRRMFLPPVMAPTGEEPSGLVLKLRSADNFPETTVSPLLKTSTETAKVFPGFTLCEGGAANETYALKSTEKSTRASRASIHFPRSRPPLRLAFIEFRIQSPR